MRTVNGGSSSLGWEIRSATDELIDSASHFFSSNGFTSQFRQFDPSGEGAVLRIGKLVSSTSDDVIIDNVDLRVRNHDEADGLYFYDGSTLHEVARIGMLTGLGNIFSSFTAFSDLSDDGTIVFMAQLSGPEFNPGPGCSSEGENNALFTWSMADGFNEIVREGDLVDGGRVVSAIEIGGADPNDSGSLAYSLELDCVEDDSPDIFIVPTSSSPAGFSAWQIGHDEETSSEASSEPSEERLTDRLALLAYAFGLEQSEPVTVEPRCFKANDKLYMKYTRIKNATDISFSVDFSTNLNAWELATPG
jgi:hypothetical protein